MPFNFGKISCKYPNFLLGVACKWRSCDKWIVLNSTQWKIWHLTALTLVNFTMICIYIDMFNDLFYVITSTCDILHFFLFNTFYLKYLQVNQNSNTLVICTGMKLWEEKFCWILFNCYVKITTKTIFLPWW